MADWIVNPDEASMLNLRAGIKPAEVRAVLPAGTPVAKLGEHPDDAVWWHVRASLAGGDVEGYLHSGYLTEATGTPVADVPVPADMPACHLAPKGNLRTQDFGRARPLDENTMPERSPADPAQIIAIIRYLDPGRSTHLRYQPKSSATYCNIYAHDYCARMGVYLPRVWWRENALATIAAGDTPQVLYANTVRELNANSLHDWFETYGGAFGWRRVFSATDLQGAANAGGVGIIIAKRKDESRSGHIAAVVPEHGHLNAARHGAEVLRPVMSQAGSRNYTAETPSSRWWLHSKFKSFGFWVHD